MQHFKKAFLVSLSFVLIIIIGFSVTVLPYIAFNSDRIVRDKLKGQIDYVIIGASHGLCAFSPEIIDKEMNVTSYNLCGSLSTFNGRKALLEEEIKRNPIKTLVFEISYNTLQRPSKEVEGDLYIVPRLNGMKKQFNYFKDNIPFNNIDTAIAYYFSNGIGTFKQLLPIALKNINNPKRIYALMEERVSTEKDLRVKGFVYRETSDISLSPESAKKTYNKQEVNRNYNHENLVIIGEIVKMCKKNNIEVIFTVTPLADSKIWEINNWDDFYGDLKEISNNYNCKLYDFNLMKSRYSILQDNKSFWGGDHLCGVGGETFTKEYCKIMNAVNSGEDVSNMFYSSYEEMKADSPYMKILNQN